MTPTGTPTEPFVAQRDPDAPGPFQVLAGGDRTAGAAMFGEARLPGHTSGPALHVHSREDEAVYVARGVVTFLVGKRRFRADAGRLVWLPREVPHAFANLDDDPAWTLAVAVPAGLDRMFAEQAAYLAGLRAPPDPERMREIGERYGVRTLGPPLDPG